jgi:membrane protease YdiL (CAAX protease family)
VALSGQIAILSASGYLNTSSSDWPLWLDAVLLIPLWVSLLAGTIVISRHWGTGSLRDDYGLRFRAFDLLGIPIGIVTQAVLIPALYWVLQIFFNFDADQVSSQARTLTDRAGSDAEVVLLVLMVVVGAPIIEELFFRGLLMRSIQARWNDGLALVVSSLFFAFVHFQVLQFAGLFVFGLIAGTCAQRTGRLGMSICAHAAFNATAVVMLLSG